jgi:adenine-specific DNA-methyltransferase
MTHLIPLLDGSVPHLSVRGDALAVLAALPPASVDAFVTDPPYGTGTKLGTTRKNRTLIRGDGKAEARRLWARFVPLCERAARPDTHHWFFGTWKSPWMAEILANHFEVVGSVAWVKSQWGLGWPLQRRWEMIYLVRKGRPRMPAKGDCDVWEAARDNATDHPCRKPVPLLRRAIRTALPPEHRDPARPPLVVDPFAGVFSTGVAAVEEGCRFLGVELDRRYHATGEARVRAAGLAPST